MSSDEENNPVANAEYSDEDDIDNHQSSVLSTGRMSKQVFSDVLVDHHHQPQIKQEENTQAEQFIQQRNPQPVIENENVAQNDETNAQNQTEKNEGGDEVEQNIQPVHEHFKAYETQQSHLKNNIQDVQSSQQILKQNEKGQQQNEQRQITETLPDQGYSYEPQAEWKGQAIENNLPPVEHSHEINEKTVEVSNTEHNFQEIHKNQDQGKEDSEHQKSFDHKNNLISAQLSAEHGEIGENQPQNDQKQGQINLGNQQIENISKPGDQVMPSPITVHQENMPEVASLGNHQEQQKFEKQQDQKQSHEKVQDGSEEVTQYSHNQISKVVEKKEEMEKIQKKLKVSELVAPVEASEANLQVQEKPLYEEQNEKYGQSVVSRRILAASVREKPKKQEEVGKTNKVCQCSLM